ncbi:hypothetical protein Pa4123_61910 [Phytohabitans aurantiacus]|uniref:TrbL/VirB6 plasmid conjugal transfer protein n=2 Tax=Phytohabitans aurantiacus TaxID=3016789 RepID=A0ABQ5R2M3_9ACTN|nr:hypothetical protein Pa4123_61910 [Phytohabitans aurantiacus]
MCAPWDTGCVATEVAAVVSNSFLGQISQMIITAELFLIDVSASWWVLVPSIKLYPNGSNTDPNAAPIDAVARIRALMLPIAAIIAMGGILWNGLLMVLSRKPAPLVNVLRGLWNTALWSAVGVFGTNLLLYGTDQFSVYVITSALRSVGEPSFAKRLASLIVPVTGPDGGIPPGLVMLVGAIATGCAFIQAMLMLFRDGSVLILAGSTSVAASGSFTNATNGWLPTLLKWQLALIFYKPTAALVYATAIWLQGENRSTDPRVLLMGIAMMIVALVALPVLLRFFNWTIGGLQSGGGGLGLLATAGASGLHAASSLRGAGGGFQPGEHARHLAETFDPGSAPRDGPNSPGNRPGPGPGPGTGPGPGSSPGTGPGPDAAPSPVFKPPAFQGEAGTGKVATITSAGAPRAASGTAGAASGSSGAAGASAAAGPAAPIVAGTVMVTSTATRTAKDAANTTANATKGQ